MASEIGSIVIDCRSMEDIQIFRNFYNEYMGKHSEYHEDVNEDDISHTSFENMSDDYSFEIDDICSLFDDPMDTPLFDLVKQFILKNPDVEFDLTYEMAWDNSGETWSEEYNYSEHVLRMETVFDPDYPDDDYDDEDEDEDEEEDDFGEPSDSAQVTNRTFEYNGTELVEKK